MSNNNVVERFTQNRELSWLKFNERVLEEATDETVPLLEQLKFISIFTSNLDEFFMIRVGSLFDMQVMNEYVIDKRSRMTPKEQLEKIYKEVRILYIQREKIYWNVEKNLRMHGIYSLDVNELEESEHKFIKSYFKTAIAPILSPQIVDTHHPFPHLQNKVIHIGALLKRKNDEVFGIIPIPDVLPDILFLPGSEVRYIAVEKIISEHAKIVFNMYEILEKVQFCITRNADIAADDEAFDINIDFRKKMKTLLHQRKRLAIVRLELSNSIGLNFEKYLCRKFCIENEQIYVLRSPMKLSYAFSLENRMPLTTRKALTYEEFIPQQTSELSINESILKQVARKDILLSYPFESMEPFLQMLREAAFDNTVISIKITIYRLANKAKLVEYLCAAAENGKDVTVLIELRARFDEQNNIDWSERLEEAGCKLIYGFEEYKVHSKICLITRKDKGDIKYITQLGTGNYNEKTAQIYTDICLITANREIGMDANEFFKNMGIGNLKSRYQQLLVAPAGLKRTILQLIDKEITKKGDGRITFKLNSITDIDIIEKLSEASCAGVQITLIVRGICCILPRVIGATDNVSVISIIGRFLEHSRIYSFGSGDDEKIYISSADFMTRNTEKRVEVACPILAENTKQKIHDILEAVKYDNVKSRVLSSDGNYILRQRNRYQINSQNLLMQQAIRNTEIYLHSGQHENYFKEKIKWMMSLVRGIL